MDNINTVQATQDPLIKALSASHSALLVTGNVYDFDITKDGIGYRPQLITDLLQDHGYQVIRYSKSQGGHILDYAGMSADEKRVIDSKLNAVGLLQCLRKDNQNTSEELRNFFRAILRLLQIPKGEGKPLAVVIDYGEHLAPRVDTSAAAADEHTVVAETLHVLANAPALRKSGNILICIVRDGLQNSLLNDLHRVEYNFPDEIQTGKFINFVLNQNDDTGKPKYGRLAENLGQEEFSRLIRGLRLHDIESMLREANAENVPLDRSQVLSAKAQAILRASEGTLTVMSNSLTLDDIIGLQAIKKVFAKVSEKLKAEDPSSPRCLLMIGPPGTSKSSFAPILATMCGFNILKFQNVKNMYVGESERRLNLALSLVESLAPSILFIDEITEAVPSRNAGENDGGVSQDLLGQLFQFSARDDLRGKVLLLGASNVPERLDPAWHDRFVIIPFLELLPDEMCKLFGVFEKRVMGTTQLDPKDRKIIEASTILHQKGASPRKIIDIVNKALLFSAKKVLTGDDILDAAKDYLGSANPMAIAYISLVSVSLTSFQSFLPWSSDPENYVYPWYLEGLVDKKSGYVNNEELHKRIQEYRRYTNL
jgi:AAA+ superfamily predicted ATPase